MSPEQISLVNSRIRIALRKFDSGEIFDATMELCKGNHRKADQLSAWFSDVSKKCKAREKLNIDIAMMRMWQLGNMDIKDISPEGKPIFSLTRNGAEKICNVDKSRWFEALLWEHQRQVV